MRHVFLSLLCVVALCSGQGCPAPAGSAGSDPAGIEAGIYTGTVTNTVVLTDASGTYPTQVSTHSTTRTFAGGVPADVNGNPVGPGASGYVQMAITAMASQIVAVQVSGSTCQVTSNVAGTMLDIYFEGSMTETYTQIAPGLVQYDAAFIAGGYNTAGEPGSGMITMSGLLRK